MSAPEVFDETVSAAFDSRPWVTITAQDRTSPTHFDQIPLLLKVDCSHTPTRLRVLVTDLAHVYYECQNQRTIHARTTATALGRADSLSQSPQSSRSSNQSEACASAMSTLAHTLNLNQNGSGLLPKDLDKQPEASFIWRNSNTMELTITLSNGSNFKIQASVLAVDSAKIIKDQLIMPLLGFASASTRVLEQARLSVVKVCSALNNKPDVQHL